MKTIAFSTIILVMFVAALAGNLAAQTENPPTASQILKAKVENGDYDALTDARTSGDLTLIPYLRRLASNSEKKKYPDSPSFRAQVALAKLGDETALEEILTEVDAEDPYVQDSAMSKLSMIGNDAAFRKFYELLDDDSPRKNPQCQAGQMCCVVYFPRNTMAMFFLSRMVEDPPTKNRMYGRKQDIPLWKEWFDKNKPWIK